MVDNQKNDDPTADAATLRSNSPERDARTDRTAGGASPTDVQSYIGRQLRAVYDDVAKQPIPDRFLALMQQLEAKGAG